MEPRDFTPVGGTYTLGQIIDAGLAALPQDPTMFKPTQAEYLEPIQFKDDYVKFVGVQGRPEPCQECHYVEAKQYEPGKDCQNYGQRNNGEMALRMVRLVAPHWHKTVINTVAPQLQMFLDKELTRMWDDIVSFHHKFHLDYGGPPRVLPHDMMDFRIKFMQEELDEYKRAFGDLRMDGETLGQREDMLDALIDLVYVALGTAYLHGFNFAEAWRRVQKANMAKVRVERISDSKRGSKYDVVKPEGWKPPSHADLVGTLEANAAYEALESERLQQGPKNESEVRWKSGADDSSVPAATQQHDLF